MFKLKPRLWEDQFWCHAGLSQDVMFELGNCFVVFKFPGRNFFKAGRV